MLAFLRWRSRMASEARRRARNRGHGGVPDFLEARTHHEGLGFVVDARSPAEETGDRPAHVMILVEHHEAVLQLADLLAGAIDLDRIYKRYNIVIMF